MVKLWLKIGQKRVQIGQIMVENQLKTGSKLVKNWLKEYHNRVQNWSNYGWKSFRKGFKLVKLWCKIGPKKVQNWSKFDWKTVSKGYKVGQYMVENRKKKKSPMLVYLVTGIELSVGKSRPAVPGTPPNFPFDFFLLKILFIAFQCRRKG